MLEFECRASERLCTQALKWALGSSVHTNFGPLGQSTAVYLMLGSCSIVGSDRAKWSNYVHRVTFRVLKVWPQHLCVLVPTGGHWFLGTKCGQPLTHLSFMQS